MHYFAHGFQLAQHHLVKRLVFPHSVILARTFVENQLAIDVWADFWTLHHQSLDYCSFVVHFDIGKCESSDFVPFFQDCFGFSGSFAVPCEF